MNNLDQTLAERGARYGKFADHALVTQEIKRVFCLQTTALCRLGRHDMAPDQEEALDMIAHKIGRILAGDPDYADSWHDIAGYAQLVANRLNNDGVQ